MMADVLRSALAGLAGLVFSFGLPPACQGADQAGGDGQFSPVSPYRPSVSSPALLPAPGQLEFEAGGLATRSGASRRSSLPYTLKLAFSPEWGILLGGEAYVSARDGGPRARGVGDTTLVLKRAFVLDDDTALGLELGSKLPSAKDSIGSGRADYSLNGIFSSDLGQFHLDTNLNLTRIGLAPDDEGGRLQTGWSAALSMPLSEQWDGTAEISANRRPGDGHAAQLLLATSYSASKLLVIDFGLARRLSGTAPDWSLFSGLVLPLAKLW